MKIKIDTNGDLHIHRKRGFIPQYCPKTGDLDTARTCGDWCPVFGDIQQINGRNDSVEFTLDLCQAVLSGDIKELVDEREEHNV